MGRVERDREIARRRNRRVKLKKLRVKYAQVTSRGEKEQVLDKARKISPFIDFQQKAEAAK